MRRLLPFVFLAGASGAGCSSIDVTSDYDPSVDFSRIHTWAWAPESKSPPPAETSPLRTDPLSLQRARAEVQTVLAHRGLSQAPPDHADAWVSVKTFLVRQYTVDPYWGWGWGYGWGPYPYAWGPPYYSYYGPPTVYVTNKRVLVVELNDPHPGSRMIWRGVARWTEDSNPSPQDRIEQMHSAVQEAVSKLPPEGALENAPEAQKTVD